MICLIPCTFVVYSGCLVVLVCIQQCHIRIFGNSYNIFLNDVFPLNFWFFSYIFKISAIFMDKSISELCIQFICVVVVWIWFTYCKMRFFVSSNLNVSSACSSLSTSFLTLVLELRKDVMLSFWLLFSAIEVLESSLKSLSIKCFFTHDCLMNMVFRLALRSLLLVVWSFRLIVYEFCCIKLLDVVCSFLNQILLKILLWIFSNLILLLWVKLKTIFELRHQVWFILMMCVYVSNFGEVVFLSVQVVYLGLDLLWLQLNNLLQNIKGLYLWIPWMACLMLLMIHHWWCYWGFIVIWSDSAAFSNCEKFVSWLFVISCCCK